MGILGDHNEITYKFNECRQLLRDTGNIEAR
jgi:hypothetical protein